MDDISFDAFVGEKEAVFLVSLLVPFDVFSFVFPLLSLHFKYFHLPLSALTRTSGGRKLND
jgi:hypothetical protein